MAKIFLKELAKALIDHGISQVDLSIGIGVHPSDMSRYMRRVRIPTSDVIARVEKFVGEDDLFPELQNASTKT